MKRKLEFRAWDEKRKTMFIVRTGYLPKGITRKRDFFIGFNNTGLEVSEYSGKGFWRVFPVMQSTGLLDKNGKGIFVGDIVKLLLDGNETRLFEVSIETVTREVVSHPSFDDATAKVAITGVVFKWEGFELFPCLENGTPDNLKMEIVGNIYENPELLQAT